MSYLIAVDDGHGLDSTGNKTPEGYKENEFNHYTKEYLIEELHNNGFMIVDCSPDRSNNSMSNRVEICNDSNADMFVSIHFNAWKGKWHDWGGIETYCYLFGGEDEKLARTVHKYLIMGTELRDRGVKTGNFYVLRNTKCISILVECGFMDVKKEAELMKSEEYRRECSREICQGICEYYGKEYIPMGGTKFPITEECIGILQEISPYYQTWIDFIDKNRQINLSGLIENLYHKDYKDGKYKKKYYNLLDEIENLIQKHKQ